jgi:hypothetical protein
VSLQHKHNKMYYQPFVITYTYLPHAPQIGQGKKHRSFERYADALAAHRRYLRLPKLYADIAVNFEIDDEVIADLEIKHDASFAPKNK